MKRLNILSCVLLIAAALLQNSAWGQPYINYSKYRGGTGEEYTSKMLVVNGETYVAGVTTSSNFPVTNGSTFHGVYDLTVAKYDQNGSVIYSTYLGGSGYEFFRSLKVINGEVYIIAESSSADYPVTNGSVYGGGTDVIITKLNTSGAIAFSTFLGGNGQDEPKEIEIAGNELFISGQTISSNFPITNGNPITAGGFITKMSAINGSIIFSEVIDYMSDYFFIQGVQKMYVQDGAVYLVGNTNSTNLPVTIGSNPPPTTGYIQHGYIKKLNSSNFNTIYSRYISGNNWENVSASELVNGELYLTGHTTSTNFPATNGSTASTALDDYDGFFTKLNSDGSIGFSTYLSSDDTEELYSLLVSNGEVFISGRTYPPSSFSLLDVIIYKINVNGTIGYTKKLRVYPYPIYPSLGILNGNLYIAGIGAKPDFVVTNGSQFYNQNFTGFFTELGPAGDIVFSTFLGKITNQLPLQVSGDKIYLLNQTDLASYQISDGTTFSGGIDNLLMIFGPGGTNIFSGYVGGSNDETPTGMAVEGGNIYLNGRTNSLNYPVTDNILLQGANDQFLTKISFCSDRYKISGDTLSPKTQTVCKYGLAQLITAPEIIVPADSLPTIYHNAIPNQQTLLRGATYQWQMAYALSGPWADIPEATFKDYTPIVGTVDQYYRRLSFSSTDCGNALIHTSDTAVALVNNLNAPTVNAGGPYHTCPGSAITIGGSPTVTGGTPPYTSYVWDMGAAPVPNPSVGPLVNTIYTLVVTDALGCKQIGQAVVLAHRADAGIDKNNCAGASVRIGTAAIADLPGIIYDWQPGTSLTATDIAQPFANPVVPTEYELTLTVPKSGGGICITKDTVKITPVAGPATPNVAGPDKVICLQDSAVLGTASEAGFNYYWSPAIYLTNDLNSIITYYPYPNANMPIPNPATITLTAQKQGCSFTDQTVVATIESRAGGPGCGPRLVGLPDRTANLNETYSWTKISGPGNFTGATNLPQVPVSASVGGNTIYGLTVSYNGGSCYSEVVVPELCSTVGGGNGCLVEIDTSAIYHCPGYAANNGDVTLIARSSITNAVYSWSPQVGLSAYTGSIVHLTDNVPRVYTVTVTDATDPSIQCTDTILVNDPLFASPVFPAPDTAICANVPVMIGLPTVTGYTYEWTGTGLSNNYISNPVATVGSQAAYKVKITNSAGCILNDTVIVYVQNIAVNAGPDWVICSNGTAKLGTAAQPNTTYSWEPQASPWQNGTDQFSAQPEVLIATDVTFTVTATTSAGCISTDQVNIVVNNSPTIPNAINRIICPGQSVQIGSPALPGVTYQWSPVTGLNNAGIAQPQANPTVTTTYTVLATFPGSCVVPATDQVIVSVSNPAFDLPDINFCPSNGPFALGVGAPVGMTNYVWFPPQMVTNSNIANPSTLNPPPNVPTTFALRVRDFNGCLYTDTIKIIPAIVAPVPGADKTICRNETLTIGSPANTAGAGISYSWSPVTNLSDPTDPTPVYTANSSGIFTYILTKTDNNVSCSSNDTIVITVQELVLPQLSTATVCQNSCVQIGTTPVNGVLYQWSPSAGLSNPAIANPVACVGTTSAIYTLTATNTDGCIATGNLVVGVNSLPAPQITIPTVTTCLGNNNTTFNPVITPPGSYSYLWSPDNGTLSNINSLNPSIITTATGTTQYNLEVTDNTSGCNSIGTGTLVVNICPTLATTGNFMWFDVNENGIQDPSESGVSSMNVKLYNSLGFNVSSTVTNSNGIYFFGDVPPGDDYYAVFSKPFGYLFTLQNVGGTAANNNSKADITGRTGNFNITPGANITNIDAGIMVDPVPITLLSFTAVLRNREVFIDWKTTAEYNNHYFDVERSNDGINFIKIGRVNGNGTTSLPHDYSLVDAHPETGINYYRLKQVDFDARYTYSHIVAVQLNKPDIISVYYNDQSNTVEITFNKKQDNMQLALYGANGQLIKYTTTEKNINAYSFKLPVLATGIYMLRIMNDKLTFTKKLYINKK